MAPANTTTTKKASKEAREVIAAATIAVKPAAGPLTLKCERLTRPTTIPPHTPAIMPLNNGAFEARATPKHKGSATRKTTIEEGRSLPSDFI
jgi:hypothetical protein